MELPRGWLAVSYRSPVAEFRRALCAILSIALLTAAPASAQGELTGIDAATYLTLFDDADLRGVERPADEVYDLFVNVTGQADLDLRVRESAEARGYVRRPLAVVDLVQVDGLELQAPAAEAWTAMKAAARADGISLRMTSAHRDLAEQQSLFRSRLGGGRSDAAIEQALRTSAPPGYSKHHSGYAVDIGQAGGSEAGFVNTAAYRWLSEADFARAKFFGFVPSYPVTGELMGPDPEAWEFVWVGSGRIACATGNELLGFCDVDGHPRLDDIRWMVDLGVTVGCAPGRFCVDDPVSRGEVASFLWRLHGAPSSIGRAPFVDVFDTDHFAPAVDWLWANGLVTGTSGTTFSPDQTLSPDEALVLALRFRSFRARPDPRGLTEQNSAGARAPVVVGDLGAFVSRAEFASVLRAIAAG